MSLFIVTSAPAGLGKCGHNLQAAQLGQEALHVVATDQGRLVLAACDDASQESS